ncbi:RdRP-domain-containing protein [Epithele typhae]|uniref:RdRP-domain-containing protein n=1 Tax=Epithele typhae TaxID=378194 RepID=UPI002008401C|nr:RdRP-domain-containing protein [Epithele typhae]KAH9940437.1 RdRP-domain-containing protein [Epithele typhae]
MEILIEDLPFTATRWEVKHAFGEILHNPPFYDPCSSNRPENIHVYLEESTNCLPNNGKGSVILSNRALGQDFFRWATKRGSPGVCVGGRRLFLKMKGGSLSKSNKAKVRELLKTPYVQPLDEQNRLQRLDEISAVVVKLDTIQFGVYFRRDGDPNTANRTFSAEHEISREDTVSGELIYNYNRKEFIVESGNPVTDDNTDLIIIEIRNIKKTAYGKDDNGQYYVCMELWHPPRFEQQTQFRAYTNDRKKDKKHFRQRLPHLGGLHEFVTPYAYQLRLLLLAPQSHDERHDELKKLKLLCEAAELAPHRSQIEVEQRDFFHPDRLATAREWMSRFAWPIRFQLEALLSNSLVTTRDLYHLSVHIEDLVNKRPALAVDFLRRLSTRLLTRGSSETVVDCFRVALETEAADSAALSDGDKGPDFLGSVKSAHAVVTPSRVLLAGPYDTQSNRIVRRYYEYREYFIRVEFREENKMTLRWPKEVNAASLIEGRFGDILKNGLDVAGRRFYFLGWSMSGLGEHTTWFMAEFDHPTEGRVTAERIRQGLGDFTKCQKIPSKYAARLAQAFSSTSPSVRIRYDQVEEIPDLGEKYKHTDGQGTISSALADLIWGAMVEERPARGKLLLKPSAVGYKGMVVVDDTLEGVAMRLRPSMCKYEVTNYEEAEIEIAKPFIKPGTARLCRPLVAVLEDLGVEKQAFLDVQNHAMKDVVEAQDTLFNVAKKLIQRYGLGDAFGLRWTLEHLARSGVVMRGNDPVGRFLLDSDFIRGIVKYAQTYALREFKYETRIPLDEAYQLVGVVDEGPAWVAAGRENVYCLADGEIFACVQYPDKEEMHYLKGNVSISRSPHIHPGDVQLVRAIGKPPADKECFFRNIKNVVVMPSTGERSLASCLAGGDVDGDEFLIIRDPTLLPKIMSQPNDYEAAKPKLLDHPSTVDDICDFFMKYMQFDVVGLVASQHLKIAVQTWGSSSTQQDGVFDERCMKLVDLCSQAVDYPKQGVHVETDAMPQPYTKIKPDWSQTQDETGRPGDFYESSRALGVLFRSIKIKDLHASAPPPRSHTEPLLPHPSYEKTKPLGDNVSRALRPALIPHLQHRAERHDADELAALEPLFRHYARELAYVCLAHAPGEGADARLSEEEVVLGVILGRCPDPRWRKSRAYRMREHAGQLVRDVRQRARGLAAPRFVRGKGKGGEVEEGPTREEVVTALRRGWAAWDFGLRYRETFGARSFGLIGLGVVCEMVEGLERMDGKEAGVSREDEEVAAADEPEESRVDGPDANIV